MSTITVTDGGQTVMTDVSKKYLPEIKVTFKNPISLSDCNGIENCGDCFKLFEYLMKGKPFTCYKPGKSFLIWSGFNGSS